MTRIVPLFNRWSSSSFRRFESMCVGSGFFVDYSYNRFSRFLRILSFEFYLLFRNLVLIVYLKFWKLARLYFVFEDFSSFLWHFLPHFAERSKRKYIFQCFLIFWINSPHFSIPKKIINCSTIFWRSSRLSIYIYKIWQISNINISHRIKRIFRTSRMQKIQLCEVF